MAKGATARVVKLCVVGTGYVGLVTGTCFAATGQRVVCVDKDASKIERLQRFEIPIYEPGLEEMVKEQAEAGRLTFTTDLFVVSYQSRYHHCDDFAVFDHLLGILLRHGSILNFQILTPVPENVQCQQS